MHHFMRNVSSSSSQYTNHTIYYFSNAILKNNTKQALILVNAFAPLARVCTFCTENFFIEKVIIILMEPRQIFTLDARDNILLEIVTEGVDTKTRYEFINSTFDELVSILSQKGVKYAELKNALIPHHDKTEITLVFNREDIDSGWYGNEIFNEVIPLLDKRSSHSILCGDMLGPEKYKEKIKEEFFKDLNQAKTVDYKHHSQFFLVYINNLTNEMVKNLNEGLLDFTPYIGYLDLTYSSFIKTLLSTVLANCCVKNKSMIICGHEEDRDNTENVNVSGYSFEENGYECKSISDNYYGPFLSYKIERQTFPNEKDTGFSINALTDDVHHVSSLSIVIDESKLAYLIKEKEANLKRAELLGFTVDELAEFIKNKIELNYIYNLTYLAEYDVLKFNVMIDVKSKKKDLMVKMIASLEYQPKSKVLRLITLF